VVEKLSWADKETQDKFREDYGGYNDLPPNFKEITYQDFIDSQFFTYTPQLIDNRQAYNVDKKGNRVGNYRGLHLYLFGDGTGIAIEKYYDNGKWALKYHKFAKCEHEYTEKTIGRCLHEYKCKKCGYTEEIDSSD
jgi:tRNA U34 2-thiouridine synthase MnmA/TrmU